MYKDNIVGNVEILVGNAKCTLALFGAENPSALARWKMRLGAEVQKPLRQANWRWKWPTNAITGV